MITFIRQREVRKDRTFDRMIATSDRTDDHSYYRFPCTSDKRTVSDALRLRKPIIHMVDILREQD